MPKRLLRKSMMGFRVRKEGCVREIGWVRSDELYFEERGGSVVRIDVRREASRAKWIREMGSCCVGRSVNCRVCAAGAS